MTLTAAVAFAGSRLDRADHVRADPERLAALRTNGARLLRLEGLLPVVDDDGGLLWDPLPASVEDELVFLGLSDGRGMFATVPEAGDIAPAYTSRELWPLLGRMNADDLAAYGGARSLVDWHARHRFCARCGAATTLAKGGWQRNCTKCDAQHFPRVDPVAIMLVEHNGNLLLGRNARFPERSYSTLAGFVEPGESIEDAVAREVFEEAGVPVRDVRYVSSQPWPFPSQLMIGCLAFADNPAITIDTTELEDARWFTRAEVAEAIELGRDSTGFLAPPRQAIAYNLMCWWLENRR